MRTQKSQTINTCHVFDAAILFPFDFDCIVPEKLKDLYHHDWSKRFEFKVEINQFFFQIHM